MKNVDVIRPGTLKSIIGPSGTLKRILKYRDYFLSRGYDIRIFTHDDMNPTTDDNYFAKPGKVTWKSRLKAKLRLAAKKWQILAWLYLYKDYASTKKLVEYYLAQNRKPAYMVFHSHLECYLYSKLSNYKEAHIAMFLHSDGIPLNMELQYYKCIEGTWVHRKLLNFFKNAVAAADKVVFITHVGEKNFRNYYKGLPEDKTCVILNGIDDLTIQQKEYKPSNIALQGDFKYKLICCGTINFRKGHRVILEALANIQKEMLSQIHLTCIGEGPERIVLEQFAEENGISKNVAFLGAKPNEEVYKYLAESNIYILMSMNEGLPISIIESMRAGLAVISTNVAGIPELVNDNGLLMNPEVENLTAVFNNMEVYDWKKMGEISRTRFEKEFTFDRMRTQYCDMLDSIK